MEWGYSYRLSHGKNSDLICMINRVVNSHMPVNPSSRSRRCSALQRENREICAIEYQRIVWSSHRCRIDNAIIMLQLFRRDIGRKLTIKTAHSVSCHSEKRQHV